VQTPHEAVTAAWDEVTSQWEDAPRHEAFLALVVQHSAFAWAAARYKERGDDPVAKDRLERIRKAATATMFASATPRETKENSPYTKTLLWLVAMVVMLVVGLLFARIVVNHAPAKGRSGSTRPPATHTTPARQ
jgi:hypothetical protein